jgi:peptidoglycan/LPS O-acetylase OafA/YrhL
LIGHIYNYIGGREVWGIRLIGGMGAKAVDIFFFLTAFLTMNSFAKKEVYASKFSGNRFIRLYPAYFVILVISFFTVSIRSRLQVEILMYLTGNNIGAFGNSYQYISKLPGLGDILQHIFLIHGIFSSDYRSSILGPLWTMSVEWCYYLIFAVVIYFGFQMESIRKKGGKYVLYLLYVLSLAGGYIYYLINAKTDMQQHMIRNIPIFIMGMLIALGFIKIIPRRETIAVAFLGLCYIFLLEPSQNWLSCGILSVVLILLMIDDKFCAIFPIKIASRMLSSVWMDTGCRLSYSLYLCHMLVIPFGFSLSMQIAKRFQMDNRVFIFIGATISMIGSFFLAYLLNRFIEHLFDSWYNGFVYKEQVDE